MADDAQLLRQYVESRSEPAFAELVQRHLGLVYHAALRQLGPDAYLAEDVVQGVFILLAEKSRTLLDHPSLAGWLHTATHFKVAHALRAERRRQAREDAAHTMSELTRESADADWEQIRPVLDEVLLELDPSDREAVLLRFFGERGFAEIGARLRITENTAHKRVERALEKLRERLARRGVKSTAVALATVFAAQSAHATPAGLAASVTSAVVASGLPAAAVAGGLVLMSTKTAVGIAAVAAVLMSGVATYEVRAKREALAAAALAEREVVALQARLQAEEERLARERAAAATPVRPPAPRAVASAPAEGDRPVSDMNVRAAEGRTLLKANPELEAAFTGYLKSTIAKENADLIAAMKLTDAEAQAFVALLANGRTQIVGRHIFRLTDAMPAAADYTRQLKELLGDERYQLYRENNRSSPARSLADDLTRSLYYTPTPMSPAQIDQFKRVVLQTLDDGSLGPRYTGASMYIPVPVWTELMKRASGVLSPAQVAALADIEQQSAYFHAQSAALSAYRKK